MKKRNTIGVMLTDINGSYLTDFWLMMEKASKEYDVIYLSVMEGHYCN